MSESPWKSRLSDLSERGMDALDTAFERWEDRREERKKFEKENPPPPWWSGQDSRRDGFPYGSLRDEQRLPRVPAIPMQPVHARYLRWLELLTFLAITLMFAIPTSAVFSVMTLMQNEFDTPGFNWDAFGTVFALASLVVPLAAMRFGQMLGKGAGVMLGMWQRSLLVFFVIATVSGGYSVWANTLVQRLLVLPVVDEQLISIEVKVTIPLVALGVYALLLECVRNYGATLRGEPGSTGQGEAIIGIGVGALLGVASRFLPAAAPSASDILVPVLYGISAAVIVVGMIGTVYATTRSTL